MIKKIKAFDLNKYKDKQILKYLFIFTLLFCILIGILVTYNFDFTDNFNLFFESDTSRVISDATEPLIHHYRLNVHPLYVLFIEPLFFIINGFTLNKMLALIIISALSTTISVIYIYKILSLYNKDNYFKVVCSLCYLFAISNIIYTSSIEIYNIAALFLILLWYYFLKKFKENSFDKYTFVILIFLGLLSLSFTITNFVIFLIIIFILFISRKVKLRYLVAITLSTIILLGGLNYFQNLVWHTTPIIWQQDLNKEKGYTEDIPLKNKIDNVIREDFSNSLIASDTYIKVIYGLKYNYNNYLFEFKSPNIIKLGATLLFYSVLLLLLIRNFKKELYINLGLSLSLLFNIILHLIYGNSCTFLYSLHFLYLIILTLGINFGLEKDKKLKKYIFIILSLFVILEIIVNNIVFLKMLKEIKKILQSTFYLNTFGFIKTFIFELALILIIAFIIYFIIKVIKRIIREKNKDIKIICFILLSLSLIFIECIFIAVEYSPKTNFFLWKYINPNTEVVHRKNKGYYMQGEFNNIFKNEIKSLKNYINEYDKFLAEYNCDTVGINYSDIFFFGFGNRRKLLFFNNHIYDIESSKIIYNFKIKQLLIVPNEYSVLIETKNHEYIKIYEDSDGVHYNKDGKDEIIDGTEQKINLYLFENQKYQNIKKVLYSEILFNIKDSIIYPNIISYDKPNYQVAAITSMALKQTNNTDLIKDWVNNFEEIFNNQDFDQYPEKLGQILYLLSTQDNINSNLVNKIERKANNIANNNKEGYYLKGNSSSDNYLYQNLWYKKGIESVGKKFKYNIDNLNDNYSTSAWWSGYKIDGENNYLSDSYPYLTIGKRHQYEKGKLIAHSNYYPLSWEKNGKKAKFNNKLIDKYYNEEKITLTHSLTASEFLLFLLDETDNLKED